jgi:hypothetical protein
MMSLRVALASLPDDRRTTATVREVILYLSAHPSTPLSSERIAHVTTMPLDSVEQVLGALFQAGVIHCDGDPRLHPVSFEPDKVLALEIERYLRVAGTPSARLQANVGKYRNRLGSA